MKLNRKWLLLVALVLSVAMATTGTLAYLTDDDADVNTMTLGKVEIVQNEQEWNADETALQQFTQDKPLLPYVGAMGWENTEADDGAYRRFTMNNVVDKYVTVTNTGKSDAYVRTIIALEMGDYTYEEFKMIGVSINKINGDEFKFPGAWEWTDDFVAEIDGHNYNIMVAVHENIVAPGETTIPSLLQVYLSKEADNETVEKLDGNGNGKYDILVLSQAIQATGFEGLGVAAGVTGNAKDAAYALDEGFGDVTTTSVKAWFEGIDEDDIGSPGDKNDTNNPPKAPNGDDDSVTYEIPADAVPVGSATELVEQVAAGNTTFVLAAGKYDISSLGGKNLTLYGESKEAVLTLVNEGEYGMDYGFDGASINFYGLTFDTTGMTTNSANQGPTWPGYARLKNATYNDCDFKGSYSPVAGIHEFNYCNFTVSGNAYNCWIYGASKVTYTNCTFDCDGKSIYVDGNGDEGTKLTATNCVFNDNGDDTVVNDKAAIETGTTYGKTYELTLTNVDVNGFTVNPTGISTGSTLWANKHSMGTDKLNVVVDGVDVY